MAKQATVPMTITGYLDSVKEIETQNGKIYSHLILIEPQERFGAISKFAVIHTEPFGGAGQELNVKVEASGSVYDRPFVRKEGPKAGEQGTYRESKIHLRYIGIA